MKTEALFYLLNNILAYEDTKGDGDTLEDVDSKVRIKKRPETLV